MVSIVDSSRFFFRIGNQQKEHSADAAAAAVNAAKATNDSVCANLTCALLSSSTAGSGSAGSGSTQLLTDVASAAWGGRVLW